MYNVILVTLDASPTDRIIIDHIKELAGILGSRVFLLHVATGVPAQWHGADAAGEEIEDDRAYLNEVQAEFAAAGVAAETVLAFGEPSKEIIEWVREHECDLVAMSTHGHQFVADLLLGTTAIKVQHHVSVPVLLIRAR